jgi:hypothetical protein
LNEPVGFITLTGHGYEFGCKQIVVTRVGGAGGPRLATCTFTRYVFGGYPRRSGEVMLITDIDAALYQEDHGIRRRAARILVLFGKQTATKIAAGVLRPDISRAGVDWARASYSCEDEFEGRPRRCKAYFDYRVDPDDTPIQPPDADVRTLAATVKELANALHIAVHDPLQKLHFGPVQ